ncbi:aminotransferase class III-fold pyridoxal phosphate-dependent enzyme [Candidatus Bathyarchaeota archaeon]|nr:aminotransferase class III-fold pyridoxal phosphate-dependent enzyme [Candidatus Bathyarchaeota archaeon]
MVDEYPKIVSLPPGVKALDEIAKDEKAISPSVFRRYAMVVESGEDCIIKDVDGNKYVDFNSGMLSLTIGHSHPKIVKAIKDQAEKLIHYPYSTFYCPIVTSLAEELIKITPLKGAGKAIFCSGNSNAVEASIRISEWYTRKNQFIAFLGSFHGVTTGSLSLTTLDQTKKKYFNQLMNVIYVPYPYCYRCLFKASFPECDYLCLSMLKEFIDKNSLADNAAAFFIEPIQIEAGCVIPPQGYFEKLKKILEAYEILLIDNEARLSFGRAGAWLSINHWKIEPDAILFGSSMASGMPLSAVVAKEDLMDLEPNSYLTISGGNLIACTAALTTIKIIREEHLIENSLRQGSFILKRLKEIQEKYEMIGDIRGKGLLIGVEIVKDKESKASAELEAKELEKKLWRRGLALICCGKSTLMLAPPITITENLINYSLDVIEDVFKEVLE